MTTTTNDLGQAGLIVNDAVNQSLGRFNQSTPPSSSVTSFANTLVPPAGGGVPAPAPAPVTPSTIDSDVLNVTQAMTIGNMGAGNQIAITNSLGQLSKDITASLNGGASQATLSQQIVQDFGNDFLTTSIGGIQTPGIETDCAGIVQDMSFANLASNNQTQLSADLVHLSQDVNVAVSTGVGLSQLTGEIDFDLAHDFANTLVPPAGGGVPAPAPTPASNFGTDISALLQVLGSGNPQTLASAASHLASDVHNAFAAAAPIASAFFSDMAHSHALFTQAASSFDSGHGITAVEHAQPQHFLQHHG